MNNHHILDIISIYYNNIHLTVIAEMLVHHSVVVFLFPLTFVCLVLSLQFSLFSLGFMNFILIFYYLLTYI